MKSVPSLSGPLPPEYEFNRTCQIYLVGIERGDSPPDYPEFISELLARYCALVPRKSLSGAEIAAMIDRRAIYSETISEAIEWVTGLVGFSVEANRQHHKRYGRSATQIAADRVKYRREQDEQNKILESITPEEEASIMEEMMAEAKDRMNQRILKAEEEISRAKETYASWLEHLSPKMNQE